MILNRVQLTVIVLLELVAVSALARLVRFPKFAKAEHLMARLALLPVIVWSLEPVQLTNINFHDIVLVLMTALRPLAIGRLGLVVLAASKFAAMAILKATKNATTAILTKPTNAPLIANLTFAAMIMFILAWKPATTAWITAWFVHRIMAALVRIVISIVNTP
jgi:hypothetical protein